MDKPEELILTEFEDALNKPNDERVQKMQSFLEKYIQAMNDSNEDNSNKYIASIKEELMKRNNVILNTKPIYGDINYSTILLHPSLTSKIECALNLLKKHPDEYDLLVSICEVITSSKKKPTNHKIIPFSFQLCKTGDCYLLYTLGDDTSIEHLLEKLLNYNIDERNI